MAFIIKRGATVPTYVAQLLQNVGTSSEGPVPDLDTAQSILFAARKNPVTTEGIMIPDFTGQMTVIDPVEAIVEYAWVVDNTLNNAGNYDVEIWITWAPGVVEIIPNDNYKVLTLKESLNAL